MKLRRTVGPLPLLLFLAGCSGPATVYGLQPEYPSPRFFTSYRADFVEVDSVQPTLRWAPFPDADDRMADRQGALARIRHVTYDLKVFSVERGYPIRVIYARSGLPEPTHRLETPLEPSAEYFWTVRARFELDGAIRVTPWGQIRTAASSDIVVPSSLYFGLRTPSLPATSAPAPPR